jgi:hypothetical protein
MLLSSVVFTLALVVKQAIILGGFSQIGIGSFPNPFFWWCGIRGARKHEVHKRAQNTRTTHK